MCMYVDRYPSTDDEILPGILAFANADVVILEFGVSNAGNVFNSV